MTKKEGFASAKSEPLNDTRNIDKGNNVFNTFHAKETIATRELIIKPIVKRHKRAFCSIVKKKIWFMFEQLWKEGYRTTIPHKVMVIRAKEYCGCDKETIRAYLGYIPKIKISKRSGEGYEAGERRSGYLQDFGYAIRKGNVWILQHENIPSYPYKYVESLDVSNLLFQHGEGLEVGNHGVVFLSPREKYEHEQRIAHSNEQLQQQHTEREKFSQVKVFPKHIGAYQLTPEEQRILEAAKNSRGDSP